MPDSDFLPKPKAPKVDRATAAYMAAHAPRAEGQPAPEREPETQLSLLRSINDKFAILLWIVAISIALSVISGLWSYFATRQP